MLGWRLRRAPWLLARLARTLRDRVPRVPAPVLDAYEVGYLAGGAQRAAEVVIGELTASDALRVDRAGQISQAGPAELTAWSGVRARNRGTDRSPASGLGRRTRCRADAPRTRYKQGR